MEGTQKKIHHGNLIVQAGETLVADFEEVTGNVYVSGSAKFEAPNLQTVGGYVDVYGSAKFEAPNLQTVGGYVYVSGSAKFEALQTVGGNVYVYGSAKFEAPNLQTVGGNVYVYGSAKFEAPNLTEKDTPEARTKAKAALDGAMKAKGLVLADGILAHIEHERGNVTIIRRIGSEKREYLVRDGEYAAHGATLAEAMADLKYKRSSRDTSQFQAWTPETEISLEDAILAYRSITGACAAGVQGFCEGRSLPERLTVARAITETRDQYGGDQFAKFFEQRI